MQLQPQLVILYAKHLEVERTPLLQESDDQLTPQVS
jgi:hypothetical protein